MATGLHEFFSDPPLLNTGSSITGLYTFKNFFWNFRPTLPIFNEPSFGADPDNTMVNVFQLFDFIFKFGF